MWLREGGKDRESSKAADLHQSLEVEKCPFFRESKANSNGWSSRGGDGANISLSILD